MDFLKSFGDGISVKGEKHDEENVELSLGLSSNGRFGVERRRVAAEDVSGENNRLIRSNSTVDYLDFKKLSSGNDETTSLTLFPLTRTCSLPIETEVEWKKRKELQSLRRSEAKRRRVEKAKNGRVVKGLGVEESYEGKIRSLVNCNGKGNELLPPLPRPSSFPSQVSVGSPASGGSSGVSDLESRPFSGTNKDTELKSTASHQPVPHQISSSNIYRSNSIASHTSSSSNLYRSSSIASQTTSSQTINRNLSSQTINKNPSKDETLKMMFADMPCVSTKGDGVNGKKIEGFLYRYRKGEEVRIVCVCHGSFLTPAEFVKHGGGGDVEHPLRHIVVMPPATFL
ncbi:putative ethylene-responsive binding factor-associated repression, Ninja family [Helianthus debilis subsp. tardiflorus]